MHQGANLVYLGGGEKCGEEKTKLVPGARIELATPAFSGRRYTNELPRRFGSFSILGALPRGVNSARSGTCDKMRHYAREREINPI